MMSEGMRNRCDVLFLGAVAVVWMAWFKNSLLATLLFII